jgi:hypothetical protein
VAVLKLGKETTVNALGKTWTIDRPELKVIRGFRDWIEEQLPDPMAIGEKYFAMLPPEEQLRRVKEAEDAKHQLKCFTLQSPLAKQYMAMEEGAAKLTQLLLQKHHPDVTVEEAFMVLQEIEPQLGKILADGRGEVPGAGPVSGNSAASA